jgi:hypothetical protein
MLRAVVEVAIALCKALLGLAVLNSPIVALAIHATRALSRHDRLPPRGYGARLHGRAARLLASSDRGPQLHPSLPSPGMRRRALRTGSRQGRRGSRAIEHVETANLYADALGAPTRRRRSQARQELRQWTRTGFPLRCAHAANRVRGHQPVRAFPGQWSASRSEITFRPAVRA